MILKNLRMKPKLMLLFLMTGIIPLAIVALIGSQSASTALMDQAFRQLETIQTIKRDKLQSTLADRISSMKLLASSRQVVQALEEFDQLSGSAGTTSFPLRADEYLKIRSRHDTLFQNFIAANEFEDVYLIDRTHGQVLYETKQAADLGSSILAGPYQNSGLGRIWAKVMQSGAVEFEDFEPYEPVGNRQAAFLGCPVRDQAGNMAGMLAVRLSAAFINHLIPSRQGLGESGESYLLRWYDAENRFELRSNMETMGQGSYVIGYSLPQVPTYWHEARRKGFDGGGGVYLDSIGNTVLVAYNSLDIVGTSWLLISKINRTEVLLPIRSQLLAVAGTGLLLLAFIAPAAFQLARRISKPLEDGVHFAEAISAGDLQARLELRQNDELGMLARALNRMARNLKEMDWLRRGKAGLDDILRGEHTPAELTRKSIAFLCRHLKSHMGLFFLCEGNELVLTASYAFTSRNGLHSRIKIGEGLVGQAVLEQEILSFFQVEKDAPTFNTGIEENTPRHFMAAPVVLDGQILGAILLGSEESFTLAQRKLLEQICPNLAILLNMANSRNTISELLSKAQEQQEMLRVANEELEEQTRMLKASQAELQAQQEEMQVTNEELAEQTKALKESERLLQDQQEELQFANDKLGERATELEEQKSAIRRKNKELLRAQEQLKLKAQELEIASRYKSEFLANMSHELRTPLNSILILSQLLGTNKDGNLTPKQIEAATAIRASGSDLLKLINEILDLSKVESGKMELHLEPVPFNNLVSDLQRIFKGIAQEKNVAFHIERDPQLPADLVTDNYRLQQILRNLLSNAFKFTSEGTVTLSIARPAPEEGEILEHVPNDETICLTVRDTGIGIPEEKQAAIFEAFKQADSSTSRRFGGTGLGLSISRELAGLLGGTIRVQSVEGTGSAFTLVMPIMHPDAELPEEGSHPEAQDVPPAPDAGETRVETQSEAAPSPAGIEDDRQEIRDDSRTVLILEHDPGIAAILRDQAREHGFLTVVATDGRTGLHCADSYAPDAILLDLELPDMDGWKILDRLKKNVRTRHIPVSVMSGAGGSLKAMRKGAIGFLSKPLDIGDLAPAFARIDTFVSKPVRRLLVVDDDPLQRESIRSLIGNGDVETVLCESGAEALQLLEEQSFDCMILDLGLKGMSGFEVLKTMRANDVWSRIPVVVYTGRDLDEDEELQLRKYAESIIVKGVRSPERLLEETTLYLHRVQANLQPEQQQLLDRSTRNGEDAFSGKTVLVADDDMRNVFALTSVLEEKGLQVIVARDGEESLRKLEENSEIGLVLMDIMMPTMDGYDAIRSIRRHARFRDLPVIALTAKAMKGDRSRCIDAGANDYLAKPVDTDKLLSMLRVWMCGQ